MNEVLITALRLSLSGSLFILMLYLFKPIIRYRLGKSWQYYIWLVVIARLLFPFSLGANIFETFFDGMEIAVNAPIVQQEVPINDTYNTIKFDNSSNVLFPSSVNTNNEQSNRIADNEHSNRIPTKTQKSTLIQQPKKALAQIFPTLWIIWLVMAVVLLVRKITIYQSFVHYIKAGRAAVSGIEHLEQFGKLLEQEKVKQVIGLYTNSLISSPLIIGFFRPCIILPSTKLSEVDFRNTIIHELTHYKRLDLFYKWLVQFTICLHWFNPLVYLMGREINRACELSCDEAVISKLNSKEQKSYGDTLLNALAMGNYHQPLASLALNEGKALIKERLDSIMKFKKKSTLAKCSTLILTFAFLCGFAVTGVYGASNGIKEIVVNQESVIEAKMKTVVFGNEVFYLIDTEEQFRSIVNDEAMLKLNYMQNKNITLTKEWIPIGTQEKPFTGTFNGNGFEIIDLKMTNKESKLIGLFGFAKEAQIYNVTLRNADIENAGGMGKTVGAICAWSDNSEVYDNKLIKANNESEIIEGVGTDNKKTTWDFGDVPRCAIKNLVSENIVVKTGGNSFQIEVDEASKSSYIFSDGIHTSSNKREIDFGRKAESSANAAYSSTIYVTIPQNASNLVLSFESENGNISIDGLNCSVLQAESKRGDIAISKTKTKTLIVDSETGALNVINTTADKIYSDKLDSQALKSDSKSNAQPSSYQDGFQNQSYIDEKATIKGIDVKASIVDLVFEESSDNIFSATLTYPASHATWYADAKLKMNTSNQTFSVEVIYPNGELNQTPGHKENALLTIRVPQRQYDKISLFKSVSSKEVTVPFSVKELELKNSVGDLSLSLLKPCESLVVENYVGDLALKLTSTPQLTNISSNIGDVYFYLPNEASDIDFKLTNATLSEFKLPSQWDYKGTWKDNGEFDTVSYKSGTGANKIEVTTATGTFHLFAR